VKLSRKLNLLVGALLVVAIVLTYVAPRFYIFAAVSALAVNVVELLIKRRGW